MKLDRNINGTGRGKYGLINNRKLIEVQAKERGTLKGEKIMFALSLLEREGILDWGPTGTESEFFVIKLRDKHAGAALYAYADIAMHDAVLAPLETTLGLREYADEVIELAHRAGPNSPFCKKPD